MTAHSLKKSNVALVMAGVMLSIFISSLDNTITSTAMPKIISELNGLELYSFPFSIYMLCSTIAIPILGKVSDAYGKKLAFGIGLVTFITASVLCGLSSNMIQLIVFRGLQGIGGGTLIANSFIIVAELFPPAERSKYMGMVVSVFGLSSILGPGLGGIITDHIGWRWIFFINLPLGFLAFLLVIMILPNSIQEHEKKVLDIGGIISFVFAAGPFILYLSLSGKYFNWFSVQGVSMLLVSVVMFMLFLWIESKAKDPIFALSAFKNPILGVSILCVFLVSNINFGIIMLVPLFLQNVKGISPAASGAYIMPMMLSLLAAGAATGLLITKTGRYKMFAVVACVLIFTGTFMFLAIGPDTDLYQIILNMMILGIGLGMTMPVFDLASQNAFPHSQIGFVTSIIQFVRNVGGTIGTAVLGAIVSIYIHNESVYPIEGLKGINHPADTASSISSTSGDISAAGSSVTVEIVNRAVHNAFIASAIVAIVLVVSVAFLKEIALRKDNYENITNKSNQIQV
ncbi:MAG: MFS transporter [Clostridia bacterium]|nr:MFS transporter [Clostridia bacterium]